MTVTLPARIHNLPSLAETLDPATVAALIDAETAPLKERAQALVDSCKRFVVAYEAGIPDDETDGIAASVLAQCQRFTSSKTGRVDAARIALKAPILAAQQQIDKAFPAISAHVIVAAAGVQKLSIAWKVAKDAAIRKAAEEEAERKRIEAEAAERLASQGSGLVTFEDAAAAYDASDKAQAVADAKPAELTRTHGSDFGVTSLKRKRVFVVMEPHLVPRQFCVPSDALIRAAIGKPDSPIPTIPGIVVRDENDLTVGR